MFVSAISGCSQSMSKKMMKNYGFFFWGGAELPDTINTRVNTDTEISYNFLHRRERHRARISKAYNSKGRKPHISIAPPGQ